MRLIATIPMRNEGWIIGYTLRAALRWADAVVILEHACTDDTREVLSQIGQESPAQIIRWVEHNPDWNEADYRQRMLSIARGFGATHLAIIDADEAFTANLDPRAIASGLRPGECARLPWLCCWRSFDRYRCDDSTFGRARVPVLVCDAPHLTHRAGPGDYQLHSRVPHGCVVSDRLERADGGVLHYQHAEWRRLLAKQAWYEMVELLRYGRIHADYAAACDERGLETVEVPPAWRNADQRYIVAGQEPWQLAEIRRLLDAHGRATFAASAVLAQVERERLLA